MPAIGRLALLIGCTCGAFMAACSNNVSSSSVETPANPSPPNRCADPRPEICTQEYIGVCAVLADSSERTYATGCTACADPNVIGWRLGECG